MIPKNLQYNDMSVHLLHIISKYSISSAVKEYRRICVVNGSQEYINTYPIEFVKEETFVFNWRSSIRKDLVSMSIWNMRKGSVVCKLPSNYW